MSDDNIVDNNMLRVLVDLRDRTLQKTRIGFSNRLSAIERGADTGSGKLVDEWLSRFNDLEKEADRDIRELAKNYPIIEKVIKVKGIGLMLAAKLVCMININEADTVSALWRYAGYAVINGVRERPVKGEKLHYNIRLKSTCYLIAGSFLKCNSPYRRIYDDARIYYDANRPDWTKLRKHYASIRKMMKIFLSHLWEKWRTQEGLSVRPPYVFEYLGHSHYFEPSEFGWE